MLTHHKIWTALDRLAERAALSPSCLAQKSRPRSHHLNKSKRITRRRPRTMALHRSVSKRSRPPHQPSTSFVQQLIDDALAPCNRGNPSRYRACGRGLYWRVVGVFSCAIRG